MRRYGNLYEQVTGFSNLLSASHKAMLGHKQKTAEARFFFNLEDELIILQRELLTHSYQPSPYRIFFIREPKPRQICAAPVRDRVVHHAICNVVGDIWDKSLIDDTFACRVGKGTHAAVARAQEFARRFKFYLQCDIRHYFETLDHAVLKKIIRRKIKDCELLRLLGVIIEQPLLNSDAGKGVPIGNLTSQYFANLYLGLLDRFIKEKLLVKGFLRYMDDFLLFSNSKESLRRYQSNVNEFVRNELALEMKDKSIVSPTSCGISFLGFRVFPNNLRLSGVKWRRFRRKVFIRERAFLSGEMDEIDLRESVRSMIAHISKTDTLAARQKLFANSLALG
jgi:RNA-directed DNA polymerase